jgi:hypothetical protein
MIPRSHFTRIADTHEVDAKTVERDYVLTHVVTAIAQQAVEHGLVLKGATALRLCYFAESGRAVLGAGSSGARRGDLGRGIRGVQVRTQSGLARNAVVQRLLALDLTENRSRNPYRHAGAGPRWTTAQGHAHRLVRPGWSGLVTGPRHGLLHRKPRGHPRRSQPRCDLPLFVLFPSLASYARRHDEYVACAPNSFAHDGRLRATVSALRRERFSRVGGTS